MPNSRVMTPHYFFLTVVIPFFCAGQAAPQPEAAKGSIEGVVLLETTREPVRRAEVVIYARKSAGGAAVMPAPPQSTATVTGPEGKFSFTGVDPGDYFLSVRKQGFNSTRNSAFASSQMVKVRPGEAVKGLLYSLLPQAVIAGKVLDEDGEPVQDAMVQSLVLRPIRGRKQWMPDQQGTRTNDRGEFRLANLSPGKVIILVSAAGQPLPAPTPQQQGQPVLGYVPFYYPGVAETAQATQVEVTAGAELTGFDVHLKRVPVFTVRGKVLAADGSPAKDFYVSLGRRDALNSYLSAMGMNPRSFTRKEDGSFEMAGVPSGSYLAMATVMNRANPLERQIASAPVDVSDRNADGLTIRLTPPANITGTVTIEGTLPAGSKPAPENLQISLVPSDINSLPASTMPARPKDDGTFSMLVSGSGRYRIGVYGNFVQGSYLASIQVGGEEYLAKEIDLSAGAPGPMKLVFKTDPGKVSGTVERTGDQPGGSLTVLLLAKDPALRTAPGGRQSGSVNQDGGFEIPGVRPGEYLALALATSDIPVIEDEETLKALESRFQTVKVAPSGSSSLQLKPSAVPADNR